MVDSKLRQSTIPLDRSHLQINMDGDGGGGSSGQTTTNMVLQNDSNGTIMETFLKNVQDLLQKLKKFDKEKSELKVMDKDVKDLFKIDRDPILSKQLVRRKKLLT